MSRQSKRSKTMKCAKFVEMDNIICPKPKGISAHAVAGAAIGAAIGGVCAGEGGAVVGGVIGYAVGTCLEPKGIEDMVFPIIR